MLWNIQQLRCIQWEVAKIPRNKLIFSPCAYSLIHGLLAILRSLRNTSPILNQSSTICRKGTNRLSPIVMNLQWARFNKHFEDESKFFSLSVKREVLGKKTSKSLMKRAQWQLWWNIYCVSVCMWYVVRVVCYTQPHTTHHTRHMHHTTHRYTARNTTQHAPHSTHHTTNHTPHTSHTHAQIHSTQLTHSHTTHSTPHTRPTFPP